MCASIPGSYFSASANGVLFITFDNANGDEQAQVFTGVIGPGVDKSVRRRLPVHKEFPKRLQKPMSDLVDAFLYLSPLDLELKEQVPADIALDVDSRMELKRRDSLPEFPGAVPTPSPKTRKDENQEIVEEAEEPIFQNHQRTVQGIARCSGNGIGLHDSRPRTFEGGTELPRPQETQ
jgi:hypothetical protein